MRVELNTYYVPWADFSEWDTVKQQIFSWDVQDTIKAYETILMWKLKYDSVPAYVECTYSLLQLSYSTALIRFVNHVSSIDSCKGETLYLAAKTLNIPDWIINMRHDAAHGQDLPALDALHVAAQLSLKWLLDNYWSDSENVKKTPLSSLNRADPKSTLEIDFNVGNLFKKAFQVWELCCNSKHKQIMRDMEQEFYLHLEEMLNLISIYLYNLNDDVVENLQNIVRDHNMPTIRLKEFKKFMLNFFKNVTVNAQAKHCLVMSLLETTFLSVTHFEPFKWRQILWLLQELKLFSMLVEILFEMAGKGHRGASNWLRVLLPSMKLLKKQWATFKILKRENRSHKTNILKKKVKKSFKSKDKDLLISLKIFKPPVLNFEMMKGVLLNPELFSVKVIVDYLKLARPLLPKSTIHLIKDLITARSEGTRAEEKLDAEEKIYTIEDVSMKNVDVAYGEKAVEGNGWTKTGIGVEAWSRCPLGLLPFQSKVDCSLSDGSRWKSNCLSLKRVAIPLMKHSMYMKKMRSF